VGAKTAVEADRRDRQTRNAEGGDRTRTRRLGTTRSGNRRPLAEQPLLSPEGHLYQGVGVPGWEDDLALLHVVATARLVLAEEPHRVHPTSSLTSA